MNGRCRRDRRRTRFLAAGLAVVAVAVAPPLEAAAGRRLSIHMAQHLLLMLLAAPLLAAGRPGAVLLEALPQATRARVGRILHRPGWHRVRRLVTQPVVVLSLFVGGFWAWHLPRLYEAALRNSAVHVVEHATFLGGAILFWSIVLDPGPRRRLSLGATCGFVFAAMLTNIWLAAGLAFASTPLYAAYQGIGAGPALADQQLAGVIMWLPADIVYFLTLGVLFRRLLRDVEGRVQRREAAAATAASAASAVGAER
ncbi:MAG TPA: cytochrome c oxidase assembly protein [Acidimicrobiia bacterium]|nr:cytochrome c oxidase assembly protein [Acidimicrobiia bacterium]